jgi:tetratricopeptide (TPR) repeat protein
MADCDQTKDGSLRIRACTAILASTPSNAQALFDRANAYGMADDHRKAIADYSDALKLEPKEARTYLNRADSYVAVYENELAISDVEKALSLLGDRDKNALATAYNTQGRASGNNGDLARALAGFGKAIELLPNFAAAYINRGFFLSASGQQDLALADFDIGLRLEPNNEGIYLNRALANRRKGDNVRAISDATEALKVRTPFRRCVFDARDQSDRVAAQ